MEQEINICIRKDDGAVDILYDGYNIISKTLYSDELVKSIINLLQNELDWDGDRLEDIIELKERW